MDTPSMSFPADKLSSEFQTNFPRASGESTWAGQIKCLNEDFLVKEVMTVPEDERGEHVYLWIRKSGQNTEYVGKLLARFAGVRKMDVGFSGLKDRWAITEQWFSIYLGNKPEPDWDAFSAEGIEIVTRQRGSKKLRRGQHEANDFRVVIKQFEALDQTDEEAVILNESDKALLEAQLTSIKQRGFPNYYGQQRFGIDSSNLVRACKYFAGEIKASRSQRSFYLSAARSYLFNLMLASAVERGSWAETGASGALYGDPVEGIAGLSEEEAGICERFPLFVAGLKKNRLQMDRRPFCVEAEQLEWRWENNELVLNFRLPPGVFATTLLAEVVAVKDASATRSMQ